MISPAAAGLWRVGCIGSLAGTIQARARLIEGGVPGSGHAYLHNAPLCPTHTVFLLTVIDKARHCNIIQQTSTSRLHLYLA